MSVQSMIGSGAAMVTVGALTVCIVGAVTTSATLAQRRSLQTPPVDIALKQNFETPTADAQTRALVGAARGFLATLSDVQKSNAIFPLDDNTQRANWSNFPDGAVERGGVMLGDLNPQQEAALDSLLATLLSEEGVQNIRWQLIAEDQLGTGGRVNFGSAYYYISFLGMPSEEAPWMLQFGGHHLAINATVNGPDVSFSPMLTGGEPLNIEVDGRPVYITARETEAALALVQSLTDTQRAEAIRGDQPINLLLGPGEFGTTVAPEGIAASDLDATQRQLLLEVITARLGFINADDFAAKMELVATDLDQTWFGWWGPVAAPGSAYFRVTGPSLVLEYSPQGRDGEATDHAHNMYRDPQNDYGVRWIAQ